MRPILLFCLAFFITTILFELFFSFAGITNPIVKIDPVRGERYFPNKTCNSIFVSEGFGLAKTNSQGWFGKEYSFNDGISIAVIGNSFVASRQVFTRNNFMSICEREINNDSLISHTSVNNFGKEAMPLQELLYVKEEIESTYNPDYIIVLINNKNLTSVTRLVPYYEVINNEFVLNTKFRQSSIFRLYEKIEWFSESSLLFLAYRVKNNLRFAPQIILDKFYFKEITEQPVTEIAENELDLTYQEIIKKLDSDKKIIFLLDLNERQLNEIKSFIKKSPVIDLTSTLSMMKNQNGFDPYYWKISDEEGHWNNAAHSVIGKDLAKNLIKIINSDHRPEPY